MGLRGRSQPEPAAPLSMVASAVRMTLSEAAWRGYRFTDEAWQRQAWDFYDTNGQLHNAVDYVGSACSLIRIFVAHVDENGVRQGEVNDDPEIAALAESLFGGPAAKAEILRGLGESLTVAGECYLIGRASDPPYRDRWAVVAPSEVRRIGNRVRVRVGHSVWEDLNPSRDMVVRVWTPHPRAPMMADSPVRSMLNLLHQYRDLELVLNSQLRSRIANAVILPVPGTLSQPRGDSEATIVDDIYTELYEVITSNLEGKGTAAQVAPILWPMPLAELEAMKGIEPIKFESVISEQAIELRKELTEKLAIAINVPVEIQLGSRELNHWGVWFAGEEFIVKSVSPLMGRIVDALTTAYLIPALKVLGRDPSRFTYWYDVAPLSSSANKLIDTLNLYKEGIVSEETVRNAASYNASNEPGEKERAQRFVRELILRDPTLFQSPEVRRFIGVPVETVMPQLETPPPPPPRPARGIEGPRPGQRPQMPQEGFEPPEEVSPTVAASLVPPCSAAHKAASNLALRALELAGKRMLTPTHRKMFPDTEVTAFHTKVKVASTEHAETLLAGAYKYADEFMEGTGVSGETVVPLLDRYLKVLLVKGVKHNQTMLSAMLDEAGVK